MNEKIDYQPIAQTIHQRQLAACPLCGCAAGMWQVTYAYANQLRAGRVAKTVMCSRTDEAPLLEMKEAHIGCALEMPPTSFEQATYREAAEVWNNYAQACQEARFKNGKGL